MTIRKGDDTNAFGFNFLTVNLENASQYVITKAEIKIGTIKKTVDNPVFPLHISLNKSETEKLNEQNNMCYMAIYDTQGRKYTCEGHLSFKVDPKVV